MSDVSVLVVEDERELADTYARWLRSEYAVRTAYTGEEALELLGEDVDVVLLDRRLPGMSGGEVLSEIREHDLDCRVAMITAVDPDYDILEMDFDDYVTKPVLRDDLRDILEYLTSLEDYDDRLRESYRLAAKIAALEGEKPDADLQDNDEYRRLRDRFRQLKQNIEAISADFTAADFTRAYRELSSGRTDPTDETKQEEE